MIELLKEYNFLMFSKEEVEQMGRDDLKMFFVSNYIENNYTCKNCKIYYATSLFLRANITTDIYLIVLDNEIVRYIEIVDKSRIFYNTDNITVAKERVKRILDGGWLK